MLSSSKFRLHRPTLFLIIAAVLGLAALRPWATSSASEDAVVIPAPVVDEQRGPQVSEVAVLAGGCFWGVQGVFQHVAGVTRAVSGYAGGEADTAHYDIVSSGTTGHAESVQITFDPTKVSYGRILQIYFSVAHDPTQLNYQGPDMGTQYRSTIFPTTEEQARVAKAYVAQLDQAHVYRDPVVTTIEPGRTFYPAEDYHQDFLSLNPNHPYIAINDLPKVENLKRMFPKVYRDDPVLVTASGPDN
jgi:peptide-methionine (S)-S-oxide reductase